MKIEKLTDDVCGASKGIVNKPIILSVYSSWVPNLTLIDLPGITRVPIDDQPENIEEITKDMATFYCKDEKTIILCVIPANQDLSTQDSLLLAKKLDPHGYRTLGVLTKVDLMDDGTDCSKILLNKEIKLRLGYIAVKGRSQMDIKRNIKVKEAKKNERNFFSNHPVYSSMPSNLLATGSLVNSLSEVFFTVVKKGLPKIKMEISERKSTCKEKLERMGEDFPESEEQKLELIFKLVRNFKQMFETEVNGKYNHSTIKKSSLKKKKKFGGSDKISFQVQEIFEGFFERYSAPGFNICDDYKDSDIQKAIEYYHGDSIPGFPSFDSFLFLVYPKLEMLKSPILKMAADCSKIIETIGSEMITLFFGKFYRLQEVIMKIFNDFVKKITSECRFILRNLVKCEENYIFTNDSLMYSSESEDRKGLKTAIETNNMLVYELRMKVNRYFNIVVRNLKDAIPKIIGRFLLQKMNEGLEFEILNKLTQVNYCLDSLEENPVLADERSKLKKMYSVLNKAENLLLNNFGISSSQLPEFSRRKPSKINTNDSDSEEEMDEECEEIESLYDEMLQFNQNLVYPPKNQRRRKPQKREKETVRRTEKVKLSTQDTTSHRASQDTKMSQPRVIQEEFTNIPRTNIVHPRPAFPNKKYQEAVNQKPARSKSRKKSTMDFDLFNAPPKTKKNGIKKTMNKTNNKNKKSMFDDIGQPNKIQNNDQNDLFNLWNNKDTTKKNPMNNPPPGLKNTKLNGSKPSKKVHKLFGL